MYWSRTGDPVDVLAFLTLACAWSVGGWLLAARVQRMRHGESLAAGTALGLLLFISLTGILSHALAFPLAAWLASALILASGLAAAIRSQGFRRSALRRELAGWPALLALAALTLLFTLINRGLAIFDDYHNLPLISTMAAGDVPPHSYLNPGQRLAYHYGLHLLAASLVRIGGFFPWSAYDLSNAFVLALTLTSAWLWFRRVIRGTLGRLLATLTLALASGARWLLLFLPVPWLLRLSERTQVIGSAAATGPDLYAVLTRAWNIEGAGPVPFPFAYASGILKPLVHSMTGSGAFPALVPVLLLLLARRRWDPGSAVIFSLALASLGLTAEAALGVLWLGLLLALVAGWGRTARRPAASGRTTSRTAILGLSAAAGVAQGGVLLEILRPLIEGSSRSPGETFGFAGFQLAWPPSQVSVHFGSLSLADPAQAFLAALELGPVILLAPAVTLLTLARLRRGDWVRSGMGLAAVLAFCLPLFLHYGVERDTTRITETALLLWLVLGLPIVWKWLERPSGRLRAAVGIAWSVGILSGVVLLAIQFIAIPRPVRSYFVTGEDARLSKRLWDSLDPAAQVFDHWPYRSVTLFGRAVRSNRSLYEPLPEWLALQAAPEPGALARQGYTHVYADEDWWWELGAEVRASYAAACVRVADEQVSDGGIFRRLYDITACR